ncbi:MAG TPA: DUF3021 family protein [Lachnospiraceae bacterium]|nr:DUF3021 family protein [Lachnospiraceae bacterium]
MKRLRKLFFTFATVTTCTVAGAAIFVNIFQQGVYLGSEILIQILFVSLATSLGSCFYPAREVCKKEIMVCILLHYIYVNVIVLVCGLWFDWYDIDNIAMILGMLVIIAAIFGTVSFICWKKSEKDTALINEKLKEFQGGKED